MFNGDVRDRFRQVLDVYHDACKTTEDDGAPASGHMVLLRER